MEITGSCYCGEIKYQAKSQNNNALVCHCSDCQRMSSGPFRAVIIAEPNSVVFTQGEAKEFVKTAQSGNKRAQGFCGTCGTTLYATNAEKEGRVYGLRIGAVDQRDEFKPSAQIWSQSTLTWLNNLHEVPAFETTPQK